ncbi:hypothetical protein EV1_035749 [Malus domestica]
MPELPIAPSYTSLIFLPHPAPPSVMYSDSIDILPILHSYAINPNFHDPQIYNPLSYRHNWFFYSENRLQFNDPHQASPYKLDRGYDSTVHTATATGTVFSVVREFNTLINSRRLNRGEQSKILLWFPSCG